MRWYSPKRNAHARKRIVLCDTHVPAKGGRGNRRTIRRPDSVLKMTGPPAHKVRTLLAHEDWDQLVAVLLRLDPAVAADFFMEIPVERRETLFRRLPMNFAARLAEILPCYDTYVLLHSRARSEERRVGKECRSR